MNSDSTIDKARVSSEVPTVVAGVATTTTRVLEGRPARSSSVPAGLSSTRAGRSFRGSFGRETLSRSRSARGSTATTVARRARTTRRPRSASTATTSSTPCALRTTPPRSSRRRARPSRCSSATRGSHHRALEVCVCVRIKRSAIFPPRDAGGGASSEARPESSYRFKPPGLYLCIV